MTATDSSTAADTRMMGIVHDALRRDLRRTREVLTSDVPTPARQREAIADHVAWMMDFLHGHHHGEDVGIYPAVRERNPAAIPLIETMDAQHQAVVPAIAKVETAAGRYRIGDHHGEGERLLATIEDLEAVLLPHLRQEEDEMMPIVSATLTGEELGRIDHELFVKAKSFVELGHEGHWLIDDLEPDRQEVVTGAVPPIPRFVLLHGFARRYRRRSAACWSTTSRAPRRVQTNGRVEVDVDAAPASVWAVAVDVTRIGEWSHECTSATWLGRATEARPGARFRGRNRSGRLRWGRVCEVVSADPWVLTWRTVPTPLYPDTSTWTIHLHERPDGGTRIEQTFHAAGPALLIRLYGIAIPAHRDRIEALTADLHRLGAIAQGETSPTSTATP